MKKKFLAWLLVFVMVLGLLPTTVFAKESESGQEVTESATSGDIYGSGTYWAFDAETGTLTISGAGAMPDLAGYTYAPWIEYRAQIKKVVIEDGVTAIGTFSFGGPKNEAYEALETLIMADSVTTVNGYAFRFAPLKEVKWSNNLISIAEYAFISTNLETLELPESLVSIGNYAFQANECLKTVNIPASVTSLGNNVFYKCTALEKATFAPFGLTTTGTYLFGGCSSLTEVELPLTLTTLARYTFYCCTALESVEIPAQVTTIDLGAFWGCTSLMEFTVPGTVTSIGTSSFRDCTNLTTVTLEEGMTTVNSWAFAGCTGLTTLYLPETLTSIGTSSFKNAATEVAVYYGGSEEAFAAISGTANLPSAATVNYDYTYPTRVEIEAQPADVIVSVGAENVTLSVTAKAIEGATISFTWYCNGVAVNADRVTVDGLTSTCAVDTAATSKSYYYCVLSATVDGAEISTQSGIVTAKVLPWSGKGAEEDPFLIENFEDLENLRAYIAGSESVSGWYFKMTADITLTADWQGLGIDNYRFDGVFDGGNYTVTVAEGGKPLFAYVKNATIKNLNIYGTKIAGYGLIDKFNGLNVTSVTYIDNVTLKSGSATLKSGLLGSEFTTNDYAGSSTGYKAEITNCTIEAGVTIGYDKDQTYIGSFAGRYTGTIKNCVSYANVYGVNYVGGIVGTIDNAMGSCTVEKSEFHGTVTGSGYCAGGIVGGGYEGNPTVWSSYYNNYLSASAPNGKRPSVLNCTVTGTVTGNTCVGGIIGGDLYVAQTWSNVIHEVKDNVFTGKVSGNAYVGGIIGYYNSLNCYDYISGNLYSAACGADRGIGFVKYLDTNAENAASTTTTVDGETLTTLVFSTETATTDCPTVAGCSWKTKHNRTDDPLGADAASLCAEIAIEVDVTVSVEGKLEVVYETVSVYDRNKDGKFDVDEVLYAVHEAFYEGGAEAGYASCTSDWGLSISMLWGDTSYCYGYWLNDASCWSLSDEVQEGDHLVAFVYTDKTYYSDAYTKFNAPEEKSGVFTILLEKAGYDESWNTVFSGLTGAVITALDSDGNALEADKYNVVELGNGYYNVVFYQVGDYTLVASSEDSVIVPAVYQLSVESIPSGVTIVSIEKTGSEGLVDTYTITFTDGSIFVFTVTNGADGEDGTNGVDGTNGIDGVDGTNGADGSDGANGKDGADGTDGIDGLDGLDGKDANNTMVVICLVLAILSMSCTVAMAAWLLLKRKK